MEGRRPVSATKKYGGDVYGSRSRNSYLRSREPAANSDDEDNLSDKGLSALYLLYYCNCIEVDWFSTQRIYQHLFCICM